MTTCPYPGVVRYDRRQMKGARAAPSAAEQRTMKDFLPDDWHMVAYKAGALLAQQKHDIVLLRRDPSYLDKNPFRRTDPEYLEFHAAMIRGFEHQHAALAERARFMVARRQDVASDKFR